MKKMTDSSGGVFATPPSLVEAVSHELRRRILAGDYEQGERLVETRLTEELGVSRPPLREALRVLEQEGLVVSEPRRGTSVVSLSTDDMNEIYTLRDSLERLAVELGVPVEDESRLQPMKDAIAGMMDAASTHQLDEMTILNLKFHRGIAALPGHRRLLASYDALAAQIQLCMSLNLAMREAISGNPGESIARHQRLLNVIEGGDRDDVLRALSVHGHRSLLDSLK